MTDPPLSPDAQALLRSAYGGLLLLTLLQALPQARRFFVSERWGGYAKSSPLVDAVQNPRALPLVVAVWLASAVLLLVGRYAVPAALVNLLLCRYFFVHMRWKSVLRGMGAPGFMTYWLAAAVFLLEYAARHDPGGRVRDAALLALRLDFAFIMLSAGLYKALAGYRRNEGMEYGMVNPWWGYWWRGYARMSPGHWLFRTLNHLAWSTEIAAALLMLLPGTRLLGGLLIFGSFLFVATQIRLGFLCEMVMLCCVLYVPEGHALDALIAGLALPETTPGGAAPALLNQGLALFCLAYAALLPFAHAGLYYNFLARRPLPGALQGVLERYTNLFGLIIWRVFTADVTNFHVHVHVEDRASGRRRLYSRPGRLDWHSGFRYLHVGEFVCFASLFTTRKYYPSQWALFAERLVRYARTIPCPPAAVLVFEYVSVRKEEQRFAFASVAEYRVDPRAGSVEEMVLDSSFSPSAAASASPVREGQRPGTYAPPPASSRPLGGAC